MAQNRSERQNQNVPALPILAEVLRQSAEPKDEGGKDENKLPTFWKVFGSTVLSISAMVVVTAYQSLSSSAAEVRGDVVALNNEMNKEFGRLAESKGELVKKDECEARLRAVWNDVKELKEDQKELLALKEKCAALVKMQQLSEQERRKLSDELQALREQHVQQEERRALAVELAALRERLAGLEAKQGAQAPAPAGSPAKVGRVKQMIDAFFALTTGKTQSDDANTRITQLLNNSEDLRQIEQEWMRIWFTDQPSHVSYDRVHGGIQ